MSRESCKNRAAWTNLIDGKPKKKPKYNNQRTNGYASKKEARVAGELKALESSGNIKNLQEQVRFVLVEGHSGIRGISYIADFTYQDPDGSEHIVDAKGMKTDIYKIKKKLMFLLHGKIVEEV